jgi:uncharacterized OB-fold protein
MPFDLTNRSKFSDNRDSDFDLVYKPLDCGRRRRQRMSQSTSVRTRPIAENLFTWPAAEPRLIGSCCGDCGARTFPKQAHCPRCTSARMDDVLLPRTGSLWTWTIQGFRPKSPPYKGDDTVDTFEPFGVGYIDLEGELLVEARLTENDPERLAVGTKMELVVLPLYHEDDGTEVLTYAFRPAESPES